MSLANITLPDLVDRPQLVERVTGNRVEILETHRWAEPLKNGISRLLAEKIASQLGSDLISVYPQNSASEPDYRVVVDIQRFESIGDSVSVDAVWSIRRTAAGEPNPDKQDKCVEEVKLCRNSAENIFFPAISGRSQVHETRGGEGYDALVAAYNRAIVSVGNDIAQTISTDWTAPPRR